MSFYTLVAELKEKQYHRIYLSHEPWQEYEARDLAQRLRNEGFEVVVGADARPHKDKPHDESDLAVVREVINSCDALVVYKKEYKTR